MALLLLSANAFATKVPLEAFAQKSQFKSVQISPDGKHIAYTFEEGNQVKLGIMNLASKKGVYAFDVGADREIADFSWINNERLYFVGANITGWLDGKPKKPEMKAVDIDGENAVFIPFSTFQKAFGSGDRMGWMAIAVNSDTPVPIVESQIKKILKTKYDIHPDDERAIGRSCTSISKYAPSYLL